MVTVGVVGDRLWEHFNRKIEYCNFVHRNISECNHNVLFVYFPRSLVAILVRVPALK